MSFNTDLNSVLSFVLPIVALFLFMVAAYGVVKQISFGEAYKEIMEKIREGLSNGR
ncbi:MAG: hypothetical protein ABSG05_03460 [Candidatus Pacearchaeota archaeon]|jgi:hypothetical protein